MNPAKIDTLIEETLVSVLFLGSVENISIGELRLDLKDEVKALKSALLSELTRELNQNRKSAIWTTDRDSEEIIARQIKYRNAYNTAIDDCIQAIRRVMG